MTQCALPHVKASGPSRRRLLAQAAAAAAFGGLAPPGEARSQPRPPAGDLIVRRVPRTGETLPAVGLGTFMTFDLLPGARRAHLHEVTRRYWEGGCRVLDTSPMYGLAEVNAGDFAASLGLGDGLFVSSKLWMTGDYLADPGLSERMLETSRQRLWRDRIDLIHVHNLVNVEQNLPLLKVWKAEGRIRYTGVSHHDPAYFGVIADLLEKDPPDFVQVRYSLATRQAEARILPEAQRRGVGVGVHMAFEKARLFHLVGARPVPDFAREAGIATWAEYFLKWVLAHPAVTCIMTATSDPDHASENVAALRGPLPDAALRARMLAYMDTLPGFRTLEATPWYPGKRYPGLVARAQAARAERLARPRP